MLEKENILQDYIKVILHRRWTIITFFIIVVVTVFIGSLKQTPVYRATTVLLIERQSPNVVSFKEVSPMGPSDYLTYRDYYETQYKLIKSRTLMEKVVDTVGYKSDKRGRRKNPVDELLRFVKTTPIRNSQLVEISAEDPSPEMAVKVANEIANEYMRQNLERNINAAHEAAVWLTKKIEEQRQKVMESELALQEYRTKHKIEILPQMTGENAVEDIKSEYAKFQAQLDSYSQRYTDEHPKKIELKAQISSLRNKIQGLEDVTMGDKTMEYMVLEREVKSNKQMYEILLNRLKEINLSSSLTGNNIMVVDRAEAPQKPFKPDLKLNMFLASMVGLIMGIGLAFVMDYLDTTIKSPEDIKEILESHFLGSIPTIEDDDEIKRDKIMHLEPNSPIAEAYRGIRTDILSRISKEDQGIKVILISSAEPQAGKTVTISNLGIALSQQGNKVLLVDCDLRRPQLHKIYNLEREKGITEYLLEGTDIGSIIKDTDIENLKVITSGKYSCNPAEIISLQKIDELILSLKNKFDFILLDSPPFINLADSIILSDKVEALVQVVRSGRTLVPIALRAKEQLAHTNAKTLGVILNDLNIYDGNYYYYYKYYHYYKDGGTRGKQKKEHSWESITKIKELCKKLNEVRDSIKSDTDKLIFLLKDKFNNRKNNNQTKEEEKIG